MEIEARGCTALVMDLARQMGLEDCGLIEDSDRLLLRLMMPVAKMYTAKKAVANISEGSAFNITFSGDCPKKARLFVI